MNRFRGQLLFASLGVLLLCLFMLSAHAADEVEIDCRSLQAANAEQAIATTTIRIVQQELMRLGFNPEKVDGILGFRTKSALAKYCRVDKVYLHWPTMINSDEFQGWQAQQPDAKAITQNLYSGQPNTVIAELGRFSNWRKRNFDTSKTEVMSAYMLNKNDLAALKAGGGVLSQIQTVLQQSYASKGELKTALQAALNGVDDADVYLDMVVLQEQTAQVLSAESLKQLKVEKIPAYVLSALQDLQDLSYPDEQLAGEVSGVLTELSSKIKAFAPEVIKLAEITPSGARFTDAGLKKFATAHANDPLAAAVLARLQFMKTVVYQSDKTISTAVNNVLNQLGDEMMSSQATILNNADVVLSYSLTEQSSALLQKQFSNNKPMPEIYLAFLQELQDVEYPSSDLFWQSVLAHIGLQGQHHSWREKIFKILRENPNSDLISQLGQMKDLQIPPLVLVQLQALVKEEICNPKVKENVCNPNKLEQKILDGFGQLAKEFASYQMTVLAQAKKNYVFDPNKPVLWSGGGCNCVKQNLSGKVYGLYPFWKAGKLQQIDFSTQSRMGFYAFGFDDKGNVPNASKWRQLNADFVREARRYGSKVDVVIQRNDWQSWQSLSLMEKKLAFEYLAGNIKNMLDEPLTDWFSRLQPWLTLGQVPTKADGVTLYFDGYPDDHDSIEAFNGFIDLLRSTLKSKKQAINMMFRSNELNSGIYQYRNMLTILEKIKIDEGDAGGQFLVLLQEPTTKDKKRLRLEVENGLEGKKRMELLRSIATVISYDGKNIEQLDDDIVYAEDNFGGIGFWSQAASHVSGQAISTSLKINYINEAMPQSGVTEQVCRVVCPNKWPFRLAFVTMVLLIIAITVLYFALCAWQRWLEHYFVHYIVLVVIPTVLLGLSLLFCDPNLADISRGNGPLIVMIVAVIAYLVWNYYHKKNLENMP